MYCSQKVIDAMLVLFAGAYAKIQKIRMKILGKSFCFGKVLNLNL